MGFTRINDNVSVHQSMPDEPNIDDGLSAEELKKKFDEPSEKLKEAVNRLLTELEDKLCSSKLGAESLYDGDTSSSNIQSKLILLKKLIDEASVGTLPDNSITEEKLITDFRNNIAKKEELGILYLVSRYRTPSIISETETEYTNPSLSSSDTKNHIVTLENYEISGSTVKDVYTMFGGDGKLRYAGNYDRPIIIKIQMPQYIKLTNIATNTNTKNAHLYIEASNDGLKWEQVYNKDERFVKNANIDCVSYYKYYRFKFANWDSGSCYVYNDIVLKGKQITSLSQNALSITAEYSNETLTEYKENQVIKIKTPNTYIYGENISSTLNIYNLGVKALPYGLKPNTRYSLLYDGEKFVHESEVQNG